METHRLEYLQKVAQYGSISKAADELFITSSALSKYIKKIEAEYHVVLFDRIGKRFALTYAGERYLQWLSEIDKLRSQMDTEMQDIALAHAGRLQIGIQFDGSNEMIDYVLPVFFKQFPHVMIEFYEDTSENLLHMLEHNKLDFALIPNMGLSPSIASIPLLKNQLVLVAPKKHTVEGHTVTKAGFRYPWFDIRKLKDEPFIAPFPEQSTFHPFHTIMQDYEMTLNIIMYTQTIGRMLRCVQNGIGLTLSTDTIITTSPYFTDLRLYSIGTHPYEHDQIIAYHKNHYLNKAAKSLISYCQNIVSKQAPGL